MHSRQRHSWWRRQGETGSGRETGREKWATEAGRRVSRQRQAGRQTEAGKDRGSQGKVGRQASRDRHGRRRQPGGRSCLAQGDRQDGSDRDKEAGLQTVHRQADKQPSRQPGR
jgi:hypothetical protein